MFRATSTPSWWRYTGRASLSITSGATTGCFHNVDLARNRGGPGILAKTSSGSISEFT
jgi:hypothetical protein